MIWNTLDIITPFQIEPLTAGFTVASGVHRHPDRVIDSYEIFFVERGTLCMYEENNVFSVQPGECLILWPGRHHGGTSIYGPDLRFCWMHFRLDNASGEPCIHIPQYTRPGNDSRVAQLIHWYLSDFKSPESTVISRQMIIMLLLSEISSAAKSETEIDPLVRQAEEIIHINYDHQLSAAGIAEMLSCSADHLSRIYSKTRGISLTGALIHRRVSMAAKLLLTTDKPVLKIGEECGFNDDSYFRRIFKRHYGVSPKTYRRGGDYMINSDCDYDMEEEVTRQ